MQFKCPICKTILKAAPEKKVHELEFFPFCSERCRLIDLGAWLDEDYRVAPPPDEEDEDNTGEKDNSQAE